MTEAASNLMTGLIGLNTIISVGIFLLVIALCKKILDDPKDK